MVQGLPAIGGKRMARRPRKMSPVHMVERYAGAARSWVKGLSF